MQTLTTTLEFFISNKKTFKQALKVAPKSPDLHNGLGTVFWAQDKQADAEKESQSF